MDEVKENNKKRLSPGATVLVTVGATALAIVVWRIIYLIITGS